MSAVGTKQALMLILTITFLISCRVVGFTQQREFFEKHYPNLKLNPNKWKYKVAATAYLNSIRTEKGLQEVKLSRWVNFQCDLYSVWHSIFYPQLRHAHIRVGSWENLATDTMWYIDAWMGSPPHRRNMLNRTTYKIGIGTAGGVAVQRGRFTY